MSRGGGRTGLLLAALTLAAARASALDPSKAPTQYVLDSWGPKEGLPEHSILDIAQTADGYVWLATQGGLVRFDGITFKVFDESRGTGFTQSLAWSIAPSRDGSLWVGGYGTGILRYRDGRLQPAFPVPSDPGVWAGRTTAYGHITLHEARDGALWAAANEWGVVRVRDGRVELKLPVLQVRGMFEDTDGTMWIGTWRDGLVRIRGDEVAHFGPKDGLAGPAVAALARTRDGTLWIGGREGLTSFRDGRFRVERRAAEVCGGEVKALLEDRDGNLWIGTATGGLCRHRDGVFSARRRIHGLSDDEITALHEDEEGGIWIGLRGSLDRMRDTSFAMFTSVEGLPVDALVQTCPARAGGLWLGTYGGGLAHLSDGRVRVYDRRHGLPHLYVGALHESADGTVWFGTGSDELCRLRGERASCLDTGRRYVKSIGEDERGILVGLSRAGLYRVEGTRVVPYRAPSGEEIHEQFVNMIHPGRDGTLWLATSAGLLAVRADGITAWREKDGLPAAGVQSLHEDGDTLWLGTGGGLVRLKGGRLSAYAGQPGLYESPIVSVIEDASGHLWLSSNKGTVRASKSELHAFAEGRQPRVATRLFGAVDGLRLVELRGPTILRGSRTSDGRLWFPTPRGLGTVHPERLVIDRRPPPVFVDEVLIDGREASASADMEVPAGADNIEIHYTALAYTAADRARFRYRLFGFDREWIDAGTRRVAQYTKLPPGTYRFQVRAANHHGVWNDEGASLQLRQVPQAHQTVWFRILMLAAGALLLLAGHRFGVRRLLADIERRKQVEQALRRAEEQVTAALREKEVLLREIHHRVKNNFQIIISLLNLQSTATKASPAQQVLRDSQDRVRSMALVHEQLYATELARIDARSYVRSLVSSLSHSYGGSERRVRTQLEVDDVALGIDAAVPAGLLLNELVSNALKHAFPEGLTGEISIELRKEASGGFLLRVSDDGIGLPGGLDFRKTESIGLQLVNNLVAQLDGTIELVPGPGTTFEVRFAEPRYKERL